MKSNKSYAVAVCLSAIFGITGIHHFYLDRVLHGFVDLVLTMLFIVMFVTGHEILGLLILLIDYGHTLIVTIMLLTGNYRDGDGNTVAYPGQQLTAS